MGTRHSMFVAPVAAATDSTVGCTTGAEGSPGESGLPGVGTAPPLTAASGGGPGVRFGLA